MYLLRCVSTSQSSAHLDDSHLRNGVVYIHEECMNATLVHTLGGAHPTGGYSAETPDSRSPANSVLPTCSTARRNGMTLIPALAQRPNPTLATRMISKRTDSRSSPLRAGRKKRAKFSSIDQWLKDARSQEDARDVLRGFASQRNRAPNLSAWCAAAAVAGAAPWLKPAPQFRPSSVRPQAGSGRWPPAGRFTRGAHTGNGKRKGQSRLPSIPPVVKKVSVAAATLAVTGAVLAAGYGYASTTDEVWARKFHERRASAVLDSKGRLVGAVTNPGGLKGDDARRFAAIPVLSDLPKAFVDTLLFVEDKGALEDRVCQMDWFSQLWRPIASGFTAGGSGLSQQLTKQLLADEGPSRLLPSTLSRLVAKAQQVGATCSLSSYMASAGRDVPRAMLRAYAEHAPFLQGHGTLRGVEAASLILWGVGPVEMTPAQAALTAVAVKRPLMAGSPEDAKIPCDKVWPRNAPDFDAELARSVPARAVLCRALHRARAALPKVLGAEELPAAMNELAQIERTGLNLQQEFKTAKPDRLVNLVTRTAALLPSAVRREMQQEATAFFTAEGGVYGAPLQLQLDVLGQQATSAAFATALRDPSAGSHLCLSLPGSETNAGESARPSLSPPCPGVSAESRPQAIVLGARADASGALRSMHASYAPMLDTPIALGSTAKIAIALAAARAGLSPEIRVCPRKWRDTTRELTRASDVAATGLTDADCRDKRNHMTLATAMARSDNLASLYAYDEFIGEERLLRALKELGFEVPSGEDPGYSATMGTIVATPRKLLEAWVALASEAYGQQAQRGARLHALRAVAGEPVDHAEGVKIAPLTPAGRDTLRALLEAPLTENGTVGFLKIKGVTAGKSGTTTGAQRVNDVRAIHAKLALTYAPDRRQGALVVVTAPTTSVPLAPPGFKTSRLRPLYGAIWAGS